MVESLDRVLLAYNDERNKPAVASLPRLGAHLHLGCNAQLLHSSGDAVRIHNASGEESELPSIGNVTGEPMLAHRAMARRSIRLRWSRD